MENYTKGEWRINRTGQDNCMIITARRDNERQDIATLEAPTELETLSNAKLIAAAPEMLKALIDITNWNMMVGTDMEKHHIIIRAKDIIKKATKQSFAEMAGAYHLDSPYHKGKKLPFNIESDGYVTTIEYKGNTPYLHQSYYSVDTLNELINNGTLKLGKISFPKGFKRQTI